MTRKDRIKAKYFKLCIEYGCYNSEEAIKWAESIIEAEKDFEYELIEIALSKNKSPNDIINFYHEFSKDIEDTEVIYDVMAKILELCKNENDFQIICGRLYMFSYYDEIPEDLKKHIYQIDHYIGDGCYDNGYVTKEDVMNEISKLEKRINEKIKEKILLI